MVGSIFQMTWPRHRKIKPFIQGAAMGKLGYESSQFGSGAVLPATMGRCVSVAGLATSPPHWCLSPSLWCLPPFLDQHAIPGSERSPELSVSGDEHHLLGDPFASPACHLGGHSRGATQVWGRGIRAPPLAPFSAPPLCNSDIPETKPNRQGIWGEAGLPGKEQASCLQLKL